MTHSGKFLTPRTPEEVFALLAIPQRFAPLLPHYESMSIEDATHFTVRIEIAVGQIRGRASLADTMGRESFDLMAQRLQNVLNGEPASPSMEMPATDTARPPDSRSKHSVSF